MSVNAPAILVKLVSQQPPLAPLYLVPAILKWYDYDQHYTVVLEDGRKITYVKTDREKPRHEQTTADVKAHPDQDAPRRELNKHKDKP